MTDRIVRDSITVINNRNPICIYADLNIKKGSSLTDAERRQVADSLDQWMRYPHIKPVHSVCLTRLQYHLEYNYTEGLRTIYFALTSTGALQGITDITASIGFGLEVAPWNRKDNGHIPVFKAVGTQLRIFGITRLHEELGDELFTPQHLWKVIFLCNRNHEKGEFDVFDTKKPITKQQILEYARNNTIKI